MTDADMAQLQEIHAALERIERGIYGRCEGCSDQLQEAWLDETPWRRQCPACAGDELAALPGPGAPAAVAVPPVS